MANLLDKDATSAHGTSNWVYVVKDSSDARMTPEDLSRTYPDYASLLAATGTFKEGDVIRTQSEGYAFEIAASDATDHHLTTAGGDKLYVLPGGDGKYNAKAFGATGDGTTDDTTALQLAIDTVGDNGTLVIPAGGYVVTSTLEIALSTDHKSTLEIIAYGARLIITGAIAGISRERPTSVSSTFTSPKIIIRGLIVEGDYTTGQHGFRFFTTYGLTLVNCQAYRCEIGFVSIFGMMSDIRGCFATQCATYGFFIGSGGSQVDFGSGAETAITGGTSSNSNSNGTVISRCRVFSRANSLAHFKVEACEAELSNCIVEGVAGANCFEYDNLGSNQSKGITIREPHVECAPTNAVYKLHTSTGSMGGTFVIEGQDTVITDASWTGALIDIGTNTPYCTIVMRSNKSIYQVDNLVKGSNITAWPQFIIDSASPDDWTDATKWGSGTVGNVTTSAPMMNGDDRMQDLSVHSYALKTGYTEWETTHNWSLIAGGHVDFDFSGAGTKDFSITGLTTGGFILEGKFAYGEAESGYTTLGSVVGRMPVYDETKTLVGYAPLYDSIT